MKSTRDEHAPERKRKIPCYANFPTGEFSSLIKKCFGYTLNMYDLDDLIFSRIFPLYHQFLHAINKEGAVIAKNSYNERNPPLLESRLSLRPIKEYLSRSSKEHFPIKFNVFFPAFEAMLNLSYSEEEIKKLRERKIKNRYLSKGIFDFASAYHYWCLSNIIDGRRIGVVNYCKNGEPNIDGDFYEFDNIQEFIPTYDEKKAFSFSERDFLINASQEEVGDRLVDILSDFKTEMGRNNPSVLAKIARQIKEYGKRLEWNPTEFFKQVGIYKK